MVIKPNDDQLEVYLRDLTPNTFADDAFSAMVIKPNDDTLRSLRAATYGSNAKVTPDFVRKALKASHASWTRIANESDKSEWLLRVTKKGAQSVLGMRGKSFVIAHFADANPWDLYHALLENGCDVMADADKCLA